MYTENSQRAKTMELYAKIISFAVISLVLLMRRVKIDLGIDFSFLPPIHALLNTFTAVALIFAGYFIKKKDIVKHRYSIYVAMFFSLLFLIGYVLYHFTTKETTYCGEGNLRYIYYFVLITHIILAGVSLPFILYAFIRGFNYQIEAHKNLVRWVYPLWLYVAITGPIVYIMLAPCYP